MRTMMHRPLATRGAKPAISAQRQGAMAGGLLGSLSAVPMVRRACASCGDHETKVMPKLDVGAAHDPLEAEADQIADQVMAKRGDASKRGQPSRMQAGEAGEKINASAGDLTSGGHALSAHTRAFFEARMGRDLSGVRVHSGENASALNSSIGAKAFTYRNHIWLGPQVDGGPSHTMAHEMAHVVQQTQPKAAQSGARAPNAAAPARASTASPVVQRACTDSRRIGLQSQVNQWCKKTQFGRGCSKDDSCGKLKIKTSNNQQCAKFREMINTECFDGGDVGHIKAMHDARRAQATCWGHYLEKKCGKKSQPKKQPHEVPVTPTVPSPVLSPEVEPKNQPVPLPVDVPVTSPFTYPVDVSSLDDLSTSEKIALAVLVAAGVVVYVILSEGSRVVFPPRNLIPIP